MTDRASSQRQCITSDIVALGQLEPRGQEPVGILHRPAKRPQGQARLPAAEQREAVEVVNLGVVGASLEETSQRLERLGEASRRVKLPDLGDRVRGPASGQRDAEQEEQRREGGRAVQTNSTRRGRHDGGG